MQFLNDVRLIQGGMGVYISNWRLAMAAAVSVPGGIAGTVSGTALNIIYSRILQDGDPGGQVKSAFQAFDALTGSDIGNKVFNRYFIEGGKDPGARYKQTSLPHLHLENGSSQIPVNAGTDSGSIELKLDKELINLYITSAFAEVWLAKQGHNGLIFINFLKKIDLPLLYSIYGAMLAGVDAVVMGAGNPDGFPRICTMLAQHQAVTMELPVMYKEVGETFHLSFDPKEYFGQAITAQPVKRPAFLAIVSLEDLATALAGSISEAPDGFVIENHRAGGHNANPVGILKKDELGQPIYSEKDMADLNTIKETGLPFWLGGGFDSMQKLEEALKAGANGVQAGSIYALSQESGMIEKHRDALFESFKNRLDDTSIVKTTTVSPTGFSFKVAMLEGTLSEREVYENRRRVCDMGILHQVGLAKPDEQGMRRIFNRCPASPVKFFVKNRGLLRNSEERTCLCNGLVAGAGYPQVVKNTTGVSMLEPAIITLGENLDGARRLSDHGNRKYNCADIAADILGLSKECSSGDAKTILNTLLYLGAAENSR